MEWLPPLTEARPRRSPRTDGFPQHRCVGMRLAEPLGSESLSIFLLVGSRSGCSGRRSSSECYRVSGGVDSLDW